MHLAVGDTVRWAAGILSHGDPMRVVAVHPSTNQVEIHSVSRVSVSQIVLVDRAPPQGDPMLEVVEAQMQAIADLTERLSDAGSELTSVEVKCGELQDTLDRLSYDEGQFEGYRDEIEARLGKLCIALGYDRIPQMPTGVPELDALVRFVHSE